MGILKKLFSKCPSPDFDQEVERISHSFLQKDASPKKLAPRFSHSRRFASEGSLVISPTSPSLTSGSTFVSHHQDSATLLSKNGDVNAEDPYMFSRYFDPSKVGSLRHSLASTNESNYIDHSKIERYSSHRDSHSSESRTIILPHSRFKNRPNSISAIHHGSSYLSHSSSSSLSPSLDNSDLSSEHCDSSSFLSNSVETSQKLLQESGDFGRASISDYEKPILMASFQKEHSSSNSNTISYLPKYAPHPQHDSKTNSSKILRPSYDDPITSKESAKQSVEKPQSQQYSSLVAHLNEMSFIQKGSEEEDPYDNEEGFEVKLKNQKSNSSSRAMEASFPSTSIHRNVFSFKKHSSMDDLRNHLQNSYESPTKYAWYYQGIDRYEAEQLLNSSPPDYVAFLVRENSQDTSSSNSPVVPNCKFSFSVKFCNRFVHLKIHEKEGSFILGGNSQPFKSITKMVSHYQMNGLKIRGKDTIYYSNPPD